VAMDDDRLREIRGNEIAMIFQDPLSSLHPLYKVGKQLTEAILTHRAVSKRQARDRAVELLGLVGIPDPAHRLDQYPHEFSGGQRQRVMIAMALANDPKLLIADEPTTALDVTVQAQILELMERLQQELGMAIVIITHDLGVVAEMADDIAVMYAGRIVETAPATEVFASPEHPYTWGLLRSIPRLERDREEPLVPIRGSRSLRRLPARAAAATGAVERAGHRCDPGAGQGGGRLHRGGARGLGGRMSVSPAQPEPGVPPPGPAPPGALVGSPAVDEPLQRGVAIASDGDPLVRAEGLVKHFPITSGLLIQRKVGAVQAVDGVDLEVRRGETLGLVGETGCGKSTTARLIMRLLDVTAGRLTFDGEDITNASGRRLKALRREMAMIFQDPYSSLNPRKTVGSVIAEPFAIHGLLKGEGERKRAVQELLETVGLNPEHYNRYPHEFSGGQRQRIGVARALALKPRLLVADEPVSALDVSIQAQVLNLLRELQREFGLTLIFIAHDLSVVRHMCDRVAVMYLGRIVETGPSDALYAFPRHPYTGALLSAVPIADPSRHGERRRLLSGDVPSPANPPKACRFHTRCPKAQELCSVEDPPMEDKGTGTSAACHFPLQEGDLVDLGLRGAA